MNLKKLKPSTNGIRHVIRYPKSLLCKYNSIIKNLRISHHNKSGRNNLGNITVRHRFTGCKKSQHLLVYTDKKFTGITLFSMYNPLKNTFCNLNFNLKYKYFFKTNSILGIAPGHIIYNNLTTPIARLGCSIGLKHLPVGTIINSIRVNGLKPQFSLSAGAFSQIIEKRENSSQLKLTSGKLVSVPTNTTTVSIGIIDNKKYYLTKKGKAGTNFLLGIRPTVRGIAMNPVDHPHGGRANGGVIWKSPWGIPTKGKKTKKNK